MIYMIRAMNEGKKVDFFVDGLEFNVHVDYSQTVTMLKSVLAWNVIWTVTCGELGEVTLGFMSATVIVLLPIQDLRKLEIYMDNHRL